MITTCLEGKCGIQKFQGPSSIKVWPLTLEAESDTLVRNAGNNSPKDAASRPRRQGF